MAAVASITLIAACGNGSDEDTAVPEDGSGSSESETEEAAPVVNTRWAVDQVEATDASVQAGDDVEAYVLIDEAGEVSGSTGCNDFGGSAEVGDGVITFQPLMATKKACADKLGEIDGAMLSVLEGEVTAEVTGDQMTLTNADDETLTLSVGEAPSTD